MNAVSLSSLRLLRVLGASAVNVSQSAITR
jgi:hypothetical protein